MCIAKMRGLKNCVPLSSIQAHRRPLGMPPDKKAWGLSYHDDQEFARFTLWVVPGGSADLIS